jgi:hypothetical protein
VPVHHNAPGPLPSMSEQVKVEDVQEPAADPVAWDLLVIAGRVIYWIVYPIGIALYHLVYYLAFAGLFIFKLLYRPLEFILLPLVYLVQFLFACLLAPFQFLARFEVGVCFVPPRNS